MSAPLRRLWRLLSLAAIAGAAACGSGPGPAVGPPAARPAARLESCLLTGVAAKVRDVVRVGVTEPVDPGHVPVPRNDGERLVFRHLYETLVRLDCRGTVRAGLAEAWSSPDGRTWTFRIRRGARFWDGSPVTASDVLASWAATLARQGAAEGTGGDWEAVLPATSDARAVDARTLRVTLDRARGEASLFGASALAVYKARDGVPWPLGTGAYGIRGVTRYAPRSVDRARPGMLTLQPAANGEEGPRPPAVQFLLAGGGDARDLLEEEVDLLITRDPTAVEYAGTLAGYRSSPLLWDRTQVLLSPALRPREGEDPELWRRGLTEAGLDALARDAVRAEARPTRPPHWWNGASECGVSALASARETNPSGRASETLDARIVYRRDDPSARDLAERLVALAAPGRAPGPAGETLVRLAERLAAAGTLRAVALDDADFAVAMRRGREAAYIEALPRRVGDDCAAVQALVDRAPWILGGAGASDLSLPAVVLPLVDTRARAVVRRGLTGLSVAWDGTVLVFGGEPERGSAP